MRGQKRCRMHGGSSPNALAAAERRLAALDAARQVQVWGGRLDVTPPEALLELVQTKAAEVAYWQWRVAGLSDAEVLARTSGSFAGKPAELVARVLKIGGVLLQVDAGADHLRELREIIYPTLKAERTSTTAIPDGFTLEATESVRYALDLVGQQQIADLLAMTPHLYRATAEGRAKAAALTALAVTVDVRLIRLRRLAGG